MDGLSLLEMRQSLPFGCDYQPLTFGCPINIIVNGFSHVYDADFW
jgi:hypothetical protein